MVTPVVKHVLKELGIAHSVTYQNTIRNMQHLIGSRSSIGNCKKLIDRTYHGRWERKQLVRRGISITILLKAG
ncbi:hypothetical protein AXFE_01980 [Acidithrix ferrooxidans]|uniref:Uncharacterized protein n=1 Tax=Acidithrix ferrooxidans TaxID=1280514 RepID=A0A0D8HP75_9ACTN|nr:hypothetical protein AXFE_01980 [Acidithrix ferrooxidans]